MSHSTPVSSLTGVQLVFDELTSLHYERHSKLKEAFSSRVSKEEILQAKSLKKNADIASGVARVVAKKSHQELLSKALQVKEKYYNDGYYCFLHANEPSRAPLGWLTKELVKRTDPTRDTKVFKFFRSNVPIQPQLADDFLKALSVHDHAQRGELISADAYFLNTSRSESANDLCAQRLSIYSLHGFAGLPPTTDDLGPLLEGIPLHNQQLFRDKFMEIAIAFFRASDCGNLSVICIPKEKVKNCVYRAHPKGSVCKCLSSNQDLFILETFQQNRIPELPPSCEGRQYRIVASFLKPENGIRSFLLTPNPVAKLMTKAAIRELADNIILAKRSLPFSNGKLFDSPKAYLPLWNRLLTGIESARGAASHAFNVSRQNEQILGKIWSHL